MFKIAIAVSALAFAGEAAIETNLGSVESVPVSEVDSQVAEKAPVVEDHHVNDIKPVVEEAPVLEDEPVVEGQHAHEKESLLEEAPVVEDPTEDDVDESTARIEYFRESFIGEYPVDSGVPEEGRYGIWSIDEGECEEGVAGASANDKMFVTYNSVKMSDGSDLIKDSLSFTLFNTDEGVPVMHSLLTLGACPGEERIVVMSATDALVNQLATDIVHPDPVLLRMKFDSIEVGADVTEAEQKLKESMNTVTRLMEEQFGTRDIISDNDMIHGSEMSRSDLIEKYTNDHNSIIQLIQEFIDEEAEANLQHDELTEAETARIMSSMGSEGESIPPVVATKENAADVTDVTIRDSVLTWVKSTFKGLVDFAQTQFGLKTEEL